MSSKVWRITDRATFDALRQSAERARRGVISVTCTDRTVAGGQPRVAFAISRRVGPAVVRNRIRRRLRDELQRLTLRPGAYLIGVAPAARLQSGEQLRGDLRQALLAVRATQ